MNKPDGNIFSLCFSIKIKIRQFSRTRVNRLIGVLLMGSQTRASVQVSGGGGPVITMFVRAPLSPSYSARGERGKRCETVCEG